MLPASNKIFRESERRKKMHPSEMWEKIETNPISVLLPRELHYREAIQWTWLLRRDAIGLIHKKPQFNV
jgi:hypothetical protein